MVGFGYVDFKREDSAEVAVKKCKVGAVSVKDRVIAADFETSEAKVQTHNIHACIHTYTYKHTFMHSYIPSHLRLQIYTYIYIYIHTVNTYIAYIHTYIHTYFIPTSVCQ